MAAGHTSSPPSSCGGRERALRRVQSEGPPFTGAERCRVQCERLLDHVGGSRSSHASAEQQNAAKNQCEHVDAMTSGHSDATPNSGGQVARFTGPFHCNTLPAPRPPTAVLAFLSETAVRLNPMATGSRDLKPLVGNWAAKGAICLGAVGVGWPHSWPDRVRPNSVGCHVRDRRSSVRYSERCSGPSAGPSRQRYATSRVGDARSSGPARQLWRALGASGNDGPMLPCRANCLAVRASIRAPLPALRQGGGRPIRRWQRSGPTRRMATPRTRSHPSPSSGRKNFTRPRQIEPTVPSRSARSSDRSGALSATAASHFSWNWSAHGRSKCRFHSSLTTTECRMRRRAVRQLCPALVCPCVPTGST